MANYDRNELLKDIRANVVEVFLVDENAIKRTVKCTLMPEIVPKNTDFKYLEEQHNKSENLSIIVCWDIEKGNWCLFRVESVEMIQLLDSYQYM